MQAFMSGKIKVQGDMMKLMAMQTAMPDDEVVAADRRGDQGDHRLMTSDAVIALSGPWALIARTTC